MYSQLSTCSKSKTQQLVGGKLTLSQPKPGKLVYQYNANRVNQSAAESHAAST